MKKALWLLITAATAAASPLAQAQFRFSWSATYDGPLQLSEDAAGIVADKNGSVYVAATVDQGQNGNDSDIAVFKYGPDGALQWMRRWNGPAGTQDVAFGMALSPDGTVVVVGRSNTPTRSSDMVTLKFRNTDGALVWENLYDGPAGSVDEALAVAVDPAGNVFVAGEVWNDAEWYPNGDFCTVKYRADGSMAWAQLYDGPGNWIALSDQPHGIAVDGNGDVIVSGDSPDLNFAARIATVKYRGADGQLLWANRSEDTNLSGYQVSLGLGPNGDPIVGSNSQDNGLQVVLNRLDGATGRSIWLVRDVFPHGGRLRYPKSMAVNSFGQIAISVTYDPDIDNSNLNYNIQTSKYAFDTGARIWSVSVGNSNLYDGQGTSLVGFDPRGNVVVAGQNLVAPHTRLSIWLFDGNLGAGLWSAENAFAKDSDHPQAMTFDKFGNLFLAGKAASNNTLWANDLFVVRYANKWAKAG